MEWVGKTALANDAAQRTAGVSPAPLGRQSERTIRSTSLSERRGGLVNAYPGLGEQASRALEQHHC